MWLDHLRSIISAWCIQLCATAALVCYNTANRTFALRKRLVIGMLMAAALCAASQRASCHLLLS